MNAAVGHVLSIPCIGDVYDGTAAADCRAWATPVTGREAVGAEEVVKGIVAVERSGVNRRTS